MNTKTNEPVIIVTVSSELISLDARLQAIAPTLGGYAADYNIGTPVTIYADGRATVIYTLVRYDDVSLYGGEGVPTEDQSAFEEAQNQAEDAELTEEAAEQVAEDAVVPQDQQAEDGEPTAETEETTPKSRRNR